MKTLTPKKVKWLYTSSIKKVLVQNLFETASINTFYFGNPS